jgi:hypothetical protein
MPWRARVNKLLCSPQHKACAQASLLIPHNCDFYIAVSPGFSSMSFHHSTLITLLTPSFSFHVLPPLNSNHTADTKLLIPRPSTT